VVPPPGGEVMESSAEVNVSPGFSQTPKVIPVTSVSAAPTVIVSLTTYPELIVQASAVPLMGPLS
jgi:hypothetical protein